LATVRANSLVVRTHHDQRAINGHRSAKVIIRCPLTGRQFCLLCAIRGSGTRENICRALATVRANSLVVRTHHDQRAINGHRNAKIITRCPIRGRQFCLLGAIRGGGTRENICRALIGVRANCLGVCTHHDQRAINGHRSAKQVLRCPVRGRQFCLLCAIRGSGTRENICRALATVRANSLVVRTHHDQRAINGHRNAKIITRCPIRSRQFCLLGAIRGGGTRKNIGGTLATVRANCLLVRTHHDQ